MLQELNKCHFVPNFRVLQLKITQQNYNKIFSNYSPFNSARAERPNLTFFDLEFIFLCGIFVFIAFINDTLAGGSKKNQRKLIFAIAVLLARPGYYFRINSRIC